MILIISKEKFEGSTEEVMDWLYKYKRSFTRLNGEDFYKSNGISASFSDQAVMLNMPDFDVNQTYSVGWYRRWSDRPLLGKLKEYGLNTEHFTAIRQTLNGDELDLRKLIFSKLKVNEWLTSPATANSNKPLVLTKCVELGIRIPNSIITGQKEILEDFYQKHPRIICKDISAPFIVYEPGKRVYSYTTEITVEVLQKLPLAFMPSLFQELIEKQYEIRAFYLDGTFYSMAIFSQLDKQTSIDFRRYNSRKPNRNVPYQLPESLEQKLREMMKQLNYKTGSLDLIRAKNGEYVFLEINPVGQFGMTSQPCNYKLEKKIAQYLTRHDC